MPFQQDQQMPHLGYFQVGDAVQRRREPGVTLYVGRVGACTLTLNDGSVSPTEDFIKVGHGGDARFTTLNPAHSTGYWYLATPYSKYLAGLDAAFREACRQAGLLMAAGVPVFCPIAHTHPIAVTAGINPLDHGIWLPLDAPLMDAARGLIVCKMVSWRESYGISVEIEAFKRPRKPILYMTPGVVPAELRP